jgi:VIT1/CCC1 family predicted Fe2+/Mn2+ transporter
MLFLGRVDVLPHRGALWAAVIVAFLQLIAVGVFVGSVSGHRASPWRFAAVSGALGLVVVALKTVLGH